MPQNSSMQSVRISLSAYVATVQCADNAAVQLSRQVLCRSALLKQALEGAEHDDALSLTLPMGVLHAWLRGLKLLEAGATNTYRENMGSSNAIQPLSGNVGLLECLQAADFLDDAEAFAALCRLVSHQLFAQYIDSGERVLDTEFAKGLFELPQNLHHSVLATSQVPVLVQLSMLPQTLHQTALLAAFPSITSSSSITVPHNWGCSQLVNPFWEVLGKQTAIKHLRCTSRLLGAYGSSGLLLSISQLTGLLSLNLGGLCIGNSHMQELSSCIMNQTALTHLNLSRNEIVGDAVQNLASALLATTALQHLDVSDNQFHDEGLQVLGPSFAALACLKVLNMRNCRVKHSNPLKHLASCSVLTELHLAGNVAVHELPHSLRACSILKRLEMPDWRSLTYFSANEASSMFWTDVAAALGSLVSLQELHFPEMKITDEQLQTLAGHITSLSSLRVLTVQVRWCTDIGISALGELITALPCLEDLHIRDDPLPRRETHIRAIALAPHLAKVYKLKRISLYGALQGRAGLEALASSIQGFSDLQTLSLAHCDIKNTVNDQMGDMLAHLPRLQRLELSHTSVSHHQFPPIMEAIGNMPRLQHLSLRHCALASDGIANLGQQLPMLTCLIELDLMQSKIGAHISSGAVANRWGRLKAFSEHLGALRALQKLNLSDTGLYDEGASALAPAMGKLTALRQLFLYKNYLTCTAVQEITKHITRLVDLEEILLSFNRIRDEGARALARCVRVLPSLHTLDLQRNQITCQE